MGVRAPQTNFITRCGVGYNAPTGDNVYVGWYWRFVVLFGILAAVTAALALVSAELDLSRKVAVAGIMLALVLWFWFYGQWQQIRSDLHAVIYLLGNILGIVASIRIWDTSSILLFAIYWFGFAYLYTIYALIYAAILTLTTQWAFGTLSSDVGLNRVTLSGIGLSVLLLGLSAMMAKYIEAFHIEAKKSQSLLMELQRTQQSLVESERAAGIEAERKRMAGEIHDTVAQQFASIITNLQAAREHENSDPVLRQQHLQNAFAAAQRGIADSRAMLSTMQPNVTLGKSLTNVIQDITAEWSRGQNLTVRCESEGTPVQLSRSQEVIMVRALQESLRNIGKHAAASDVVVRLSWLEDEVLMDISDNGMGFDFAGLVPGSDGYQLGLSTMESRVESCGGTFALEAAPNECTSITISFPTGGTP